MHYNEARFVWTDSMTTAVRWLSFVPAVASLIASTLVLTFAGALYLRPLARHAVKRQIFILLLAVQVASIFSSAAYIVETFMIKATPLCAPMLIVGTLSNNFFAFVISLIAFNLQLVVVHNVNTRGYTKWYLTASLVASATSVLPGAVKRVWGWDSLSDACWIRLVDPDARVAWVIGTQYPPNLLASFIALVSTIVVLWHLLSVEISMRRVFSARNDRASVRPHTKLVRQVVFRIIWYPLLLTVVNAISMAADMSVNNHGGVKTEAEYRLWCVYAFLFGAGPFFYALVALFLDPTFSAAIRAHILKAAAPAPAGPFIGSSLGFHRGLSATANPGLTPATSTASGGQACEDSRSDEPRRTSKMTLSTLSPLPETKEQPNSSPDLDSESACPVGSLSEGLRRRMSLNKDRPEWRQSLDLYTL